MRPVAAPPDLRADLAPWVIRGVGLAIGVLIVVAIGTLSLAAGNVLLLLFLSILLASALQPMVGSIRSRVGLGRGMTILLVYASFFVVVLGFALIVVPGSISRPSGSRRRSPRSSRRHERGRPISDRARSGRRSPR